jgi:hypothetical protein
MWLLKMLSGVVDLSLLLGKGWWTGGCDKDNNAGRINQQ